MLVCSLSGWLGALNSRHQLKIVSPGTECMASVRLWWALLILRSMMLPSLQVEGEADLLKRAASARAVPGYKVHTKSAAMEARTGAKETIKVAKSEAKAAKAEAKASAKAEAKAKNKAKAKAKASGKGSKLASSPAAGLGVKKKMKATALKPDGAPTSAKVSKDMDESDKRGTCERTLFSNRTLPK